MQEPTGEALRRLIIAARSDREFPLRGDPEAVRARLRACMADGDIFAALDDAELDWLSI